MKRNTNPLSDLVAYRQSLGETQTEFWTRFGVTQPGGSRYESGRKVPAPVVMLMQAWACGLLDDKTLNMLAKSARNM